MKLYAPGYYTEFKCIADRCTHSCCVGWEICIDDETLEMYKRMKSDGVDDIIDTVSYSEDGTASFRLISGRCPHLTSEGLCRIIADHGEAAVSEICREHPRFYNFTARGAEVGLGGSCEEAARIILTSENCYITSEIGELVGEAEPREFDTVSARAELFGILSDGSIPYYSRLRLLWERYGRVRENIGDGRISDLLSSLEYLDPSHRELFLSCKAEAFPERDAQIYCERFLVYLINRHTASADGEAEFLLSLKLCFFLERLYASLLETTEARDLDSAVRLMRIISEEIEYSEDNTEQILFEFEFE